MVSVRLIFLFLPVLLMLGIGPGMALEINTTTGRDRVGPGESLELKLRLDESPPAEPDLGPLEEDWEILNQTQSSQRQYVNGAFSSSFVYNFTLMPRRTGSLTIPPICFGPSCSDPIPVEASSRSTLKNAPEKQVKLETQLSRGKLLPQAQLLLKVRLSLLSGLPEGRLNEPEPAGVKVQIKKLTDVRKFEQGANGRTYQVFERDYAIFPQESGTLRIPPLTYSGLVAGEPTRLDPFARKGMRIIRRTQPIEVEVGPLPADLGRRPWIPATLLTLADGWQQDPPTLVVGEPATRTLQISADGVLAAQLPGLNLNLSSDFRVYPDQPERKEERIRTGVRGLFEQKVMLVPTKPGHYRLPEVNLDWWDTGAGRWRTARLAPLEVDVAPAPTVAPLPPVKATPGQEEQGTQKFPTPPASVVPPEEVPDPPMTPAPGYWRWLSLGLGLGWFLTLHFFWRRRSKIPPPTEAEDGAGLQEKAARQAVVKAARCNDPRASRTALVAWSRTLFPADQSPYERLRREAPAELLAALGRLDQHLYAASTVEWQGTGLATAIGSWETGANQSKRRELPDLYPPE